MARQKRLLTVIFSAVILVVAAAGAWDADIAMAASSCTVSDRVFGFCGSATTNDDSVQVRARRQSHEQKRTVRAPSSAVAVSAARPLEHHSSAVLDAEQFQDALNAICVGDGDCGTRQGAELNPLILDQQPAAPVAPVDVAAANAPARGITIEDVARFLPAAVTLHAEPDGWAVIGVPANFWTYVQPLTVEANLLGEQAAVRFTPQLYRWDYGDGASTTTRSGGASWSGLGQGELTRTTTSHTYAAGATAQASVTVIWSAEYRFAGGAWIPVAGAVSNSSPETRMLVVKERTVLTAR